MTTALIACIVVSVAVGAVLGAVFERLVLDARRARRVDDERVVANPVLVRAAIADEFKGRHRCGVAPGSSAQRARWNSETHEFHVLVDTAWSPREREELREIAT